MAIPFLKGIDVAGTVDLSNLKIDGAQGTDGQVLTSTGSGIAWEDVAGGTSDTAERIEVTVKNVSGGSLSKGTVVHASPSATPPSGNVIEVIAADYDDSTKMPAIGILNETIADTAEGSAVMMGAVSGIDTSSFSIGDELYVGNLGALTSTKPAAAGQLIQKIAVVVKSHASNGLIKIFGAGRSNDVPLPLYIDNTNQRVGIGVALPDHKLHLEESDTTSVFLKTENTAGALLVGNNSAGNSFVSSQTSGKDLLFETVNTERMRIHSNGNVSVGTTNAYARFSVKATSHNNGISVNRQADTTAALYIGNDGGSNPVLAANNADMLFGRDLSGTFTERMRLTNSGRLGIGATGPSHQLHVHSDTDNDYVARFEGSTNNGSGVWTGIGIGGESNNTKSAIIFEDIGVSYSRGKLHLAVNNELNQNNATKADAKLTVNNDGNVGIGETDPNRPLVVSETRYGSTASDAYTAVIKSVQTSGASPNPGTGGLKVQYTSSSFNVHAFGLVAGSSSSDFLTTGPMHFYTNSDLDTVSATGFAMQLDTSQRLILGSMTASQKLNVSGNVTADRYYGNGSTAYYLDPNDTSVSIRVAGFVDAGPDAAFRCYDGTNFRGGIGDGQWASGNSSYTNDLAIYAPNSFNLHAGSNTPLLRASSSNQSINHVGNITSDAMQRPVARWGASGSSTGMIAIALPGDTGDYDMTTIEIEVYEYNSNAGSKIRVSGHPYNTGTGWYNYSVSIDGVFNKSIYLGKSSSKFYILLGDTSSSWSYGSVIVRANTEAEFYNNVTPWGDAWSITQVTTDPTSVKTSNLNTTSSRTSYTYGYSESGSSFRAPIFYDSSNSNFNWDPGTDNSHRFTTASGYIDIGPKNTSWCHIYTDRNGFYFNKTTFQLNGNQVWHAGNDGSASGLDADLLDGLHASSFLRSDANDTWSGDISTASTNGIRFGSANQTDTNDGYIAAGRFASGLNIVGTQTTAGTGRQIRLWGNLITNDGNAYWHAGNDGSGSGLDADLLDGVQGANYFKKGADIGGSQNLNNYTTDGYYHQNANANASSGSNYPVSAAGMLSVVSDGSMVYQTYHQYNGNAYYHRSYYNGTWYAWRKVWQDGNDGSGSGLDADTVDGIQGASFLRSDANDSFTGSELHFPTLDLSISNNNAQNQGNTYFRGTGTHFVLGLNNGNTCYLNYGNTSGALRLYGSSIYWNDSNIGAPWGSGNDGSGSGLDADTVDGIQGGSFLRSDADDTATGVITINNDLYLGTYSGTTQARLFLNGTTANKQAKIQCTNGNLHIDSEDGHSLYLNYYEGTTDNVIIGNGNGGSSGTILKSTGRINVGEHLIAANNVYAGGSEGFVFGSSTSEGEYIKRNGSNIEFVAYGEIKFDITAQGVHVRTGSTYRAQISNTGIGRFANDVVAYYNFSDKRLKTNIKPTTNNLDKVLKLNPVEYNWKEGYRKDKKEIGLIAQEVEKIIPEVVRENQRLNDDTLYKQIDYEHLVSTLIGAVQEQQKQIDELKSIINGGS